MHKDGRQARESERKSMLEGVSMLFLHCDPEVSTAFGQAGSAFPMMGVRSNWVMNGGDG